jgi:hypothetical protein
MPSFLSVRLFQVSPGRSFAGSCLGLSAPSRRLLAEGPLDLNVEGGLYHLLGLVQLKRLAIHYPLVDGSQTCANKFWL